MDVSIELNVADAQIAGAEKEGEATIILGSDEIGISLSGTREELKKTLQEAMDVLDGMSLN